MMEMLTRKDIGLHSVTHQDGAENHNQLVFQDFAHLQDIAERNGQKDGEKLHQLQSCIRSEKKIQILQIPKDTLNNKKKFMVFGEESLHSSKNQIEIYLWNFDKLFKKISI
jgi:hypothetical protein